MSLAVWEAELCLPREGYLPEVISCFSWGGRQERGQARAKAEKAPIRAQRRPHPSASLLPTSPWSGLRARKGTAGAVCPDRPVGWGSRQVAERRQLSYGFCPNPTLSPWDSLSCPPPKSSANQVGQPSAQHSKEDICSIAGESWSSTAHGHQWDALQELEARCGPYNEAAEGEGSQSNTCSPRTKPRVLLGSLSSVGIII